MNTQSSPDDHGGTPTHAPRFGLFLSQANKSWSRVLDDFQMAEELGFDHAWLVDHLVDTDGPPENGCLGLDPVVGDRSKDEPDPDRDPRFE